MRAGRLVSLMLILQDRGRVTASVLAEELEVSQRTVLRDIEELSGAGLPVYSTRGPGGGFQLVAGYVAPDISIPGPARRASRASGVTRRATVRVSAEGRRLAAVLGRLQPLRVRRNDEIDDDGWCRATFRLHSIEGATLDVLSLGPHIEVTAPPELRLAVAERVHRTAALYPPETTSDPPVSASRRP